MDNVFRVEVGLNLKRPVRTQMVRRVVLSDECCAHHAELIAIDMAIAPYKAVMATYSLVIDWSEDCITYCGKDTQD